MLFVHIILPIFLVIGAGYFLEKKFELDFQPLTISSLYLFSPALVLSALLEKSIDIDLALDLFFFMVLYSLAMLLVAVSVGRSLKMDDEKRRALSLTTVVMNVGNFGLPLSFFAFGKEGMEVAILTFVMFNIPLGTLAIVIAQGSSATLSKAMLNTAKIPIFHAVALAFILKASQVQLPDFLLHPLDLLGQAAIPVMLVLLGMQIARTRITANPGFISLASILRLGIAPLLAWWLTDLLGIDGLYQKVVVLQTSTPSAVLPLLYSLRFNTRPDLVASTIVVTTLLSTLSLTVILYLQ